MPQAHVVQGIVLYFRTTWREDAWDDGEWDEEEMGVGRWRKEESGGKQPVNILLSAMLPTQPAFKLKTSGALEPHRVHY